MHVNKRVTRVQRVTESKLLAWYKENIPAPSPTLPSPPPDDSNHTETLRFRVGMLHKIRHREFTNVLGFVLLICTRFIHANRSKRREWTVFNKGNAKISLSWQVSPIFWLSIALHYRPAWLNILPVFPKYEVDWRSWIDIAWIFQFFLLCHRHVG